MSILQDIRFALRQSIARPLFTVTAVATIALGIGANAAIFSVVNGLLFSPLPFADADRLAFAWRASQTSEMMLTPDGELIERWRAASGSFEAIEVWTTAEAVVRTAAGPRALRTAAISAGFMATLRLAPALGRDLRPDDEAESAPPVVLLSHGYWRVEFAGAADVIGRTLAIGGTDHTIVGVAPAGLLLPTEMERSPDLWLPLRRNGDGFTARGLLTLARMREGVTRERAEAELSAISALAAQDAGTESFPRARLTAPADLLGPGVQRALLVLLGAVGFVLLIACANVTNLLLVRAAGRTTELSVRAALGAGRGRLVRQLLVESLLLGAAGCIAGLVLAQWGLDLIVAIRPETLRELERVRIDGRVTAYAVLLTVATSVFFGLLPALRATHDVGLLRAPARSVAGGRTTRRITGGLIVAEVALSLVLLVGAGLLIRTFLVLQAAPLRFEPNGLWAARVQLPVGEDGASDRRPFHASLRDAVAALPGVTAVHLVSAVPPGYGISFGALALDGDAPADGAASVFASNFVPPGYFETLGMQFIEGRAFTPADGAGVVVVGEAFARRFFEGPAVGHRIRVGDDAAWRTIVGVAADLPAQGLARSASSFDQLHFPAADFPLEQLLIASDLPAATLAPALRSVLARLDPGAALAELDPLAQLLASSLDRQRFNLTLLLVLAALATVLSAVGLYGVVSVAVAGRTREIGIRRALGATDASVVRLALAEGMLPALLGVAVGLAAALLLTRLMTRLLYGLDPHDPLTLGLVPVLLGIVALLASWLPGRRAARIEPVEALRLDG